MCSTMLKASFSVKQRIQTRLKTMFKIGKKGHNTAISKNSITPKKKMNSK